MSNLNVSSLTWVSWTGEIKMNLVVGQCRYLNPKDWIILSFGSDSRYAFQRVDDLSGKIWNIVLLAWEIYVRYGWYVPNGIVQILIENWVTCLLCTHCVLLRNELMREIITINRVKAITTSCFQYNIFFFQSHQFENKISHIWTKWARHQEV